MNPRSADDVLRDIIQLAVGARAELRAAYPDEFKSDRMLSHQGYETGRAATVNATAKRSRKARAPKPTKGDPKP